jgi:uncharacterized protein
MVEVKGRVLVAGAASGPLLRLTRPISFWGGVDAVRGVISDPRHPEHGRAIAGTVLLVPSAVGSSSSSAIVLEAMREGTAPAAILMGRADAILALGVVVGRELGYDAIPVVEVDPEAVDAWPDGVTVEVDDRGRVRSRAFSRSPRR